MACHFFIIQLAPHYAKVLIQAPSCQMQTGSLKPNVGFRFGRAQIWMESITYFVSQKLLRHAEVKSMRAGDHLSNLYCSQQLRDCLQGRSGEFWLQSSLAMANRAELQLHCWTVGVSVGHNAQHHENALRTNLLVLENKLTVSSQKSKRRLFEYGLPHALYQECHMCSWRKKSPTLLTTPQKWLFWLWTEKPKFLYSVAMESEPTNAAPETGWKGTEKEVEGRRALKNSL